MLVKVPKDSATTESHATFRGDEWNGHIARRTNGLWYIGVARGVCPLHQQESNGWYAYKPNRGTWVLMIHEASSAADSTLCLGTKTDDTNPTSEMDIAWAGVWSGTLTDAERDQVYLMARKLLRERGKYLDYRDCPTQADVLAQWGQSNAEGRAQITDLTTAEQARTTPANVYISQRTNADYEPLEMGLNHTSQDVETQFGPEMQISWNAEDNGHALYIQKYAITGTRLYNVNAANWSLDDSITDGLFHNAMKNLWQMEADMLNAGIGPRLRGMVWMQGESDAVDATHGAAYGDAFPGWLAKFREQVADSECRIAIGRIRNQWASYDPQGIIDVRAAQDAVADDITTVIDTDSFPLFDTLHYDADGQKSLGDAFYEAIYA